MPLFGSKHKHDKEPTATSGHHHAMGPASANHHDHSNTQVLKGENGVPTAVGSGAGPGISVQPGLLTGQPAGMAEAPRRDQGHGGVHGTHSAGHGATGYSAHGLDDTVHSGYGSHDNRSPGHDSGSGGGAGTRMTGKVESAIGSAFNSESMKLKGLEKQREADLIQKQGSELAEAEGLEREAAMHRQRAEGLANHGGPMDNNDMHRGGRQPY